MLANPDATTLGVIGTGKQSRTQVMAVCAVRPIKRILVFARTAASREAMPRRWRRRSASRYGRLPSAEACVGEADVVVTITKSAEPVFRADWLAKGAHVNAAGANSADRREVDADTVLRAAVKATDQIAQAKVEAAEFRDLVAAGKLAWSDVRELGDIVTGKVKGRSSPSTSPVQVARHRARGHGASARSSTRRPWRKASAAAFDRVERSPFLPVRPRIDVNLYHANLVSQTRCSAQAMHR